MATITFPLLTVADDSGAVVSGATVTIASVTDKVGAAISSPGAIVNVAGANVSVDYDAEAKGEAWVTLAISKVGSTFTGLNAAPAFYLASDSSRVASNLDAKVSTRSTYAGGAVASVTGNVGGSVASVTTGVTLAANQDVRNATGSVATVTNPVALTSAYDSAKTAAQAATALSTATWPNSLAAALIADEDPANQATALTTLVTRIVAGLLLTPGNKLATNSSGYVTATNGGSGGGSGPTVDDIATRLLVNPANKLATDSSGYASANLLEIAGDADAATALKVQSLLTDVPDDTLAAIVSAFLDEVVAGEPLRKSLRRVIAALAGRMDLSTVPGKVRFLLPDGTEAFRCDLARTQITDGVDL